MKYYATTRQILTIFAFVLMQLSTQAQPYAVGKTTRNYIDAARNNRSINTEIYYPATTAGTNTPVAVGAHAVVAVGHGFVMGIDAYYHLRDSLVPMGYVVALVNTEGGIQPSHANFGADIRMVAQSVADENTQTASIFNGKLNGKKAILGHSMGGGAGVLAATNNANIDAYIGFAPAETNPSATAAAAAVACPTLIFGGSSDCVTPPTTNQLPMYNAAKNLSNCATYIEIVGGSHCKFANNNAACNFGEANCPGTLQRNVQHEIIFKYLMPFLNYTLKSNPNSLTVFKNTLITDPAITYQQQCNTINTTEINENIALNIQQNPDGSHQITANEPVLMIIYDVLGKKIIQNNDYKNEYKTVWNVEKTGLDAKNTVWLLQFTNKNNATQTIKIK